MRDEVIERLILPEPLCSRFGAYLIDTWNVVRGVTDECEIVDDLLGPHIELGFYAIAIIDAARHRINERDVLADELAHVFIACRDQHSLPCCGRAPS